MSAPRCLLLALGLIAASWTDLRQRKIPNRLTVPLAAAGLVLALLDRHLLGALGAMAFGLVLGVVLWLLGIFRAGDAKLSAALGALTASWLWVLDSLCWAVVLGGGIGLLLLLVRGELLSRLKRVWDHLRFLLMDRSFHPYVPQKGTEGELPFAPFVALGTLLACFVPLWQDLL